MNAFFITYMKLLTKDYFFVGIQFLLFIFYIVNIELFGSYFIINFSEIGLILICCGVLIMCIALLQLNINLSPFPSPKNNSVLIQNGLFKYIRHPVYTGILFNLFGYGLYSQSFYKLSITVVLFILFYYKSVYEEKRLSSKFTIYSGYKKGTGRFFPKFYKTNPK